MSIFNSVTSVELLYDETYGSIDQKMEMLFRDSYYRWIRSSLEIDRERFFSSWRAVYGPIPLGDVALCELTTGSYG